MKRRKVKEGREDVVYALVYLIGVGSYEAIKKTMKDTKYMGFHLGERLKSPILA